MSISFGKTCNLLGATLPQNELNNDVARLTQPTSFKLVNNLICWKIGLMWLVKRATLLFNSFCRNVAKQFARSCCPFYRTFKSHPRGRYFLEFLMGVCHPVLQILTLFQTKKCHFSHPFSDLASKIHPCFQTWRWSQNATYTFTSTEIMSSLLRLERQQKYFFLIHL